ncbi:DapH/DapD/GlmU-related protein [Pseudobutyrivibrio sp.]|uniref:DapH/DapD/GlmU-related protein n=1 Tax=Pseudobutyrivibrio sp. TaxID=2014367 RepID=UPI0038661449
MIASNVLICSENHGIDPESTTPYMSQPLISKPVSIGEGSWIGEMVCILPGVHIGKKCIIGAGSVVTKSIPDYSIAVGNPAKVIKKYNFKTHNWEKV